MAPIIEWGNMCINAKTWWDSYKNKDEYLNTFYFPSFYTHIQLTASCTFLLALICFFILYHYFQIERIVWQELDRVVYYFPSMQLYARRYVRRATFFCCFYISVILTGHLFEKPSAFYFVKVLYVSNFAIIKEVARIKYYRVMKPMFFHLQRMNPLSTNPTKWPNTLKQLVGKLPTNCLGVFNYFLGLALKWLSVAARDPSYN